MATIKVGDENSTSIDLYYEDHGVGEPVVLIHGWPLSGRSWENQVTALLDAGYRVIAYDRRGFGYSSKPAFGYNYDTLAKDLNEILTRLDLNNVTLIGFSMGNGEVARYLSKYGSSRVSKAVFIAPILPFLLQTSDNPEGVDPELFEQIKSGIKDDRLAFLSQFFKNFYNHGMFGSTVSEEVVRFSWNVAAAASPIATLDCVAAWLEDFREDVLKIEVPSLIIQGDGDKILPFDATGKRLAKLIPNSELVKIDAAPHGLLASHADKINAELLRFLGRSAKRPRPTVTERPSRSLQ